MTDASIAGSAGFWRFWRLWERNRPLPPAPQESPQDAPGAIAVVGEILTALADYDLAAAECAEYSATGQAEGWTAARCEEWNVSYERLLAARDRLTIDAIRRLVRL